MIRLKNYCQNWKENLSSFRYRRKFRQKENKNENEEPKLVYKAVIRVNKRIFHNNEITKKEPIENKYQKFKENVFENKPKNNKPNDYNFEGVTSSVIRQISFLSC